MGGSVNPHPHELHPLLLALGVAGVELAPHPTAHDWLRFKCPGGPDRLAPDLLEGLRRHRGAILGLLADGYHPEPGSEAEYVLGERLGIADDCNRPTHPGTPAWLIAVGESMGTANTRRAGLDKMHTVCQY